MKKKLAAMFMLLLSLSISFSSCSDDDETIKAELSVNPATIEISALGGDTTAIVTTNLDSWNVTADASANWCTVTKNGNKLSIKVEEFSERQDRKAVIKVTSGDEIKDLAIIQKGVSATLTPEKTEINMNGFGSAVKVKITASSSEWIATTEDKWIRLEQEGEFLIIRTTLSSSDRNGSIDLALNDAKSEIKVKQTGAETAIGSLILGGADGSVAVGVIISNANNTIYAISMEEKKVHFTNSKDQKIYVRTDTLKNNGQKATAALKAVEGYKDKFEIAAYCDEIDSKTGMTGWYIPGAQEKEVWDALKNNATTINATLSSAGGQVLHALKDKYFEGYWTSSVNYYKADGYASGVEMKELFKYPAFKSPVYQYPARCILKIEYLSE